MDINKEINTIIEYKKQEEYYHKKIKETLINLGKEYQKIPARELQIFFTKMKKLQEYFEIEHVQDSKDGQLYLKFSFVSKLDLYNENKIVYNVTFIINEPLILKTRDERLKVFIRLKELMYKNYKTIMDNKDFQYSFKDKTLTVFNKKFKTEIVYTEENIEGILKPNIILTLATKDDPKYSHLKPLLLYLVNEGKETVSINI